MNRVITGVLLLCVGGACLIRGGIPLVMFLMLAGLLSFYEVEKMTGPNTYSLMIPNMVLYGVFMAGLGASFLGIISFDLWAMILEHPLIKGGICLLVALLFGVFLIEFYSKQLFFRSHLILNNMRFFLYISFGFGSVYIIRHIEYVGGMLTAFMFLSIWATDMFAYYGGKQFGQRRLSSISPKKTIEGMVIGVSASMVLAVFFMAAFLDQPSVVGLFFGAISAGILGLAAQFGDLYESLIKRTYNVKDSSGLLPGHGGILDRADSTLFVAPLIVVLVLLGLF